ncbi:cysteine-rich venom protein VAR4 [Biomphalaria pfeifferi]|uniref:Cysteine-rich venom protein VAR4 n=1 Tax=Biomphalaria pfeifferi TaxID=112525 RepID=A0AAD8BC22_BIOPF|nr:cysteine-rich venom protein VAR4 [Biomphalaria pfeifferi]
MLKGRENLQCHVKAVLVIAALTLNSVQSTIIPINDELKEIIIDRHNDLRRPVKANYMNKLVWDEALARKAEQFVSKCRYERPSPEDYDAGVNMGIRRQSIRESDSDQTIRFVDSCVDGWSKSQNNYAYGTHCNQSCPYAQMIEADCENIGCAIENCDNRLYRDDRWIPGHFAFMVCLYNPWKSLTSNVPYQRSYFNYCTRCPENRVCEENLCALREQPPPLQPSLEGAPVKPSVYVDKKAQIWSSIGGRYMDPGIEKHLQQPLYGGIRFYDPCRFAAPPPRICPEVVHCKEPPTPPLHGCPPAPPCECPSPKRCICPEVKACECPAATTCKELPPQQPVRSTICNPCEERPPRTFFSCPKSESCEDRLPPVPPLFRPVNDFGDALDSSEMSTLLNSHNDLRKSRGLKDLVWDEGYLSQWVKYIINCYSNFPGPRGTCTNFQRLHQGESVASVLANWSREGSTNLSQIRVSSGCRTKNDEGTCNHYQNLMRDDTDAMACEAKFCGDGRQLVCLYAASKDCNWQQGSQESQVRPARTWRPRNPIYNRQYWNERN